MNTPSANTFFSSGESDEVEIPPNDLCRGADNSVKMLSTNLLILLCFASVSISYLNHAMTIHDGINCRDTPGPRAAPPPIVPSDRANRRQTRGPAQQTIRPARPNAPLS